MATPTPRAALVTAKVLAARVRAWSGALVAVPGSALFNCLSTIIAGLVLSWDPMIGIGQTIRMSLFFVSGARYPVALMLAGTSAY